MSSCSISDPFALHSTAARGLRSLEEAIPPKLERSALPTAALCFSMIAEFPRPVLDLLRQPLEDGKVRLSRMQETTVFPAAVTLVAATNPFP